jgi:HSP20 family protein
MTTEPQNGKEEVNDMTLVKFSPLRDMVVTQNRLNRLVDSFFAERFGHEGNEPSGWSPRVDVEETDTAIVFRADLPGMHKEDMHIATEDGRLTLRGERKLHHEEEDKNYRRLERAHGSFSRTYALPPTVVADKIEASYKEGVLEVTVPKAEEVKPREIEIR